MVSEILNELGSSHFQYDKRHETIEPKEVNVSAYAIMELMRIVTKLQNNSIKYSLDSNYKIKII